VERPGILSGKRILLGVSGGIAAYKLSRSCEAHGAGAEVRVVMTRNASRFVAPLTFPLSAEAGADR